MWNNKATQQHSQSRRGRWLDDDWLSNSHRSSIQQKEPEVDLIDFETDISTLGLSDKPSSPTGAENLFRGNGNTNIQAKIRNFQRSLLDISPPDISIEHPNTHSVTSRRDDFDNSDEDSEALHADSIIDMDLQSLDCMQAKLKAGETIRTDSAFPHDVAEATTANAKLYVPSNDEKVAPAVDIYQLRTSSESQGQRAHAPLPIEPSKYKIVEMVRSSRVVVLSGSTGCGKSTQVPQYVLDDCLSRHEYINIICTQPRRIAATSIAHRVATERGSRLGDQIGYHIGGHAGYTEDQTRLRYMTTGILLEMLKGDRYLERCSHIIMDEIHERNVDDDLMMAHLCVIMRKNTNLKLVVMSATMNVSKFTQYFSNLPNPLANSDFLSAPTIDIPARCYPVDTFYLEDICDGLGLSEAHRVMVLNERCRPERRDAMLGWITFCHAAEPPGNAFLVFLPGIAMIAEIEEQLLFLDHQQRSTTFATGATPPPAMQIIKVHSTVTIDEQALVMLPAPAGYRKIILATNIAESSITVPDVHIVFDSCLRKDVHYDAKSRCFSLNEGWISRDCGEQRKGRAGRTGPGVIYRFVPQVFYDSLPSERTPEILRTPLNALLLRCIDARLGDPRAILARCIDPPEDATVDVALDDLVTIGAVIKRKVAVEFEEDDDDDDDDVWVRTNEFVFEYEVTMLGRVLARLPLDLHAGLLVVYGALFGQLREAIIMAAVLQNKGVIVQPPGLEISISATLKRFHIDLPDDQPLRGGADLISQLRAYLYWEETTQFEHSFDLAHELQWCQEQNLSLYWIREVQDLVLTVRESLAKHSICAAPTKAERDRIRRNRVVKVRPAMLEVGIDNEEGIKQLETNEEDIKQPEINEEGTKQSETGTGEDANKRADVQTAYFTEYDTTDIEDAIKVLDTAAAENNAMSNTPVSSEIGDTIPHPIDTIGFTRSLTKRSIDLDEPFAPGESPPNPWVNIFDRAHNITAQAVQLQREPNALLLTLLLTAAFHDNMLRVSPTDASSFRNCPTEYNRAHTIEFTARQLPPKGVMIETLQREVGLISRIDHTENTSIDDVCYVEFIKPAKPIWNHSRDGGELPDAVYIAQKMKTTRNSNWDTLAEYPESTAQLRFSTISSDPDTATKLSPMFHSNQSRAFLSRFSLFFPIISPKRDQDRYTVSAARLLAVERGRSWVADYVTCLINPTPYEGIGIGQDMKPDYGNTGDLIIALFGNDVDMTGGWSIGVGGQTYPLFYDVPPKSVQRVLAAVRVYLRHALFERLPLLPEIADEEYREVNIAAIQSMARVARAWEMKLRPEVAGDLLVKTILMCL